MVGKRKIPPLSPDEQSQGAQKEQGTAVRFASISSQRRNQDWGENTLNAVPERGVQGITDELIQLRPGVVKANPGVCPAEVPSQ